MSDPVIFSANELEEKVAKIISAASRGRAVRSDIMRGVRAIIALIPPAPDAAPELLEALRECAEALDCEQSRHAAHIGEEPEDVGAKSALEAADAAIAKATGLALLPPAPDGATEGEAKDALRYRYLREHCSDHHPMTQEQPAEWSLGWEFQQHTPDERFGSFDKWIDRDIERLDEDERAALAPSVSPVRPKGEEKPQFWLILHDRGCVPNLKGPWPDSMVREVLREFMRELPDTLIDCLRLLDGRPVVDHGPELLTMLDGRSAPLARRHNTATADLPAPSQTGEENAGLVAEAEEYPEAHDGDEYSTDLIRRLADALVTADTLVAELRADYPGGKVVMSQEAFDELAFRSPIPGELKALSDAATADWPEPEYDNDTGPDDGGFWEWWAIEGVGKFDSEEDAKLARAAVMHVRQALAAEGGVASAADSA